MTIRTHYIFRQEASMSDNIAVKVSVRRTLTIKKTDRHSRKDGHGRHARPEQVATSHIHSRPANTVRSNDDRRHFCPPFWSMSMRIDRAFDLTLVDITEGYAFCRRKGNSSRSWRGGRHSNMEHTYKHRSAAGVLRFREKAVLHR